MKTSTFCLGIAAALSLASAVAQNLPGPPEENGLTPKTETIYINTPFEEINNGSTESLGVAIASNGNVLVGWEDDGDDLTDLAAVWTLFNSSGVWITPETEITTQDPQFAGLTVASRLLSYFRPDGSAVSGRTAWGPKIKANLFGPGLGMGATAFDLGWEVSELAGFLDQGDFPAVQLLTDNGEPAGIVTGLSETDAGSDGDVRIADWGFLANGNIVIVGESRQEGDLATRFGGAAPGRHVIYRIVDRDGNEVKGVSLAGAVPESNEIWHGLGVTANGFGVRFSQGGRAIVRLFDNDGNAVTDNLDIGALTEHEIAAGGGRGDGTGFHGNGNDAYVIINKGSDDQGAAQAWLTVLEANGDVRYSRAVADDLELVSASGRTDAAIDPSGRVFAVFHDPAGTGGNASLVLGRLFDAEGEPMGGTFYVSELELPEPFTFEARNPRVAWRNGLAAVVWESLNSFDTFDRVVALRLFSTFRPGSIESAGLARIVPDTPVINPGADALGNWEPYASVLGNSVFLIEGNTFAEGSNSEQRYVVALQPVDGGAMETVEAFYTDDGQPFDGAINASRQNGNPGRVAGDKRPGAVHYMTGGEASPHVLPEFDSNSRWFPGFDRLSDGRYATVQAFELDKDTLTPTPASLAIDAVNGRLTSGFAPGSQITRFGGDIAALDNGNFVVVVDDRSETLEPSTSTTAVILAPDGSVVKETFVVDTRDIWSNVAAFQGGFCVRVHETLNFFDNDGELMGSVDQSSSGEQFDTGRGDGTRIAGHINSPFVFLGGKVSTGNIVKVAAWDARDRSLVAVGDVSEPGFAGDFDRVNLAVDALNRVAVAWVSQPPDYEMQQVAARVLRLDAAGSSFTPLTGSFLPFVNAAKTGGIRSLQPSVAMTTREICVAAKGEINLQNQPDAGADSPSEINFYTVISHPDPQPDPTPPLGGSAQPLLSVTRDGTNVTIAWTGAGFTLQSAQNVTGPWTPVATTGASHTAPAAGAAGFFRLTDQP